jgi:hypothetical protein
MVPITTDIQVVHMDLEKANFSHDKIEKKALQKYGVFSNGYQSS